MENKEKTIDWEQRTFEMLKSVLQGMYAGGAYGDAKENVDVAIRITKAAIKAIKNQEV